MYSDGTTNNGKKMRSRETIKEDETWFYSSSAGRHELLDHPLLLFFYEGNQRGKHSTTGTDTTERTTGERSV